MIVFLNNQYLDEKLAFISAGDAGFLYGEGVFTTLRLYQGFAPDLEGHLQRLQLQARTLEIPFSMSLTMAVEIVENLVEQNCLQNSDARLRWTVSRGADLRHPFPDTPSSDQAPTVLVSARALPSSFDDENLQGIPVKILGPEYQRNHSPQLKTLNYLPSVQALREAQKGGCREAIIMDQEGNLCEGAVSNLFLVTDGLLLTPPDQGQILAGRTRQIILNVARKNNLTCLESPLTSSHLEDAHEVFLCNSIRQIVPVISIDGHSVANGQVGPITRTIQQWYASAMQTKKKPAS